MEKQIIKTEEYGIPPSIKDYRQDFNVPDTITDEYIWYYIQFKKKNTRNRRRLSKTT